MGPCACYNLRSVLGTPRPLPALLRPLLLRLLRWRLLLLLQQLPLGRRSACLGATPALPASCPGTCSVVLRLRHGRPLLLLRLPLLGLPLLKGRLLVRRRRCLALLLPVLGMPPLPLLKACPQLWRL